MIPVDAALAASAAVPAPAPAGAPASARAVVEGQLAMLSRLAEIGMEIAEACGRDVRAAAAAAEDGAAPAPEPRRDPGLVFARAARAVRMTIALQSRVLKDLAALARADDLTERARRDARRIRLSRLVEQAARAGVEARRAAGAAYFADEDALEDEIEQLSCDAYERLTDAEDGEEVGGLGFEEAVAQVCKDLGLSADWAARLSAAVAPPGSSHPPPRAGVWSATSRPWVPKGPEGRAGDAPPDGSPLDPAGRRDGAPAGGGAWRGAIPPPLGLSP